MDYQIIDTDNGYELRYIHQNNSTEAVYTSVSLADVCAFIKLQEMEVEIL